MAWKCEKMIPQNFKIVLYSTTFYREFSFMLTQSVTLLLYTWKKYGTIFVILHLNHLFFSLH